MVECRPATLRKMGSQQEVAGVLQRARAVLEQYWLLVMFLVTGACSLHVFHWEAHDKKLLAQHLIDYNDPNQSYWGPPTSAIDWCEDNYVRSRYIAEFWNTVTSCILTLGGVLGVKEALSNGLEPRFFWCYAMLILVGIGSILFHSTLLYELQMADELPMMWASLAWMYVLINNECVDHKNKVNWPALAAYGAFATVMFIFITEELPAVFQMHILVQAVWAVHNVCSMLQSMNEEPIHGPAKRIFNIYGFVGLIGFFCWVIENATCSRLAAHGIHPQLHAWWHLCMTINTYCGPMFVAYKRGLVLGKKPEVSVGLWGLPTVRYTLREVKVE